ncbi:MAG: transglutaminase domain-containing protein [Candidatus Methanomethylicaceae archaeon]
MKLFLIPLLLLTVPYMSTYQYSINITLVNLGEELSPEVPGTPYYYLLNQNIFPNTTYQTVFLRDVLLDGKPAQFEMFEDEDGNPCIKVYSNRSLGEYQSAELIMNFVFQTEKKSFDLSEIGNISQIPRVLSEEYSLRGAFDLSKLPNPDKVLSTAISLKGDNENVLQIISNILMWFEENMRYNSELVAPQDLWTTYSTMSGDCDDQANLFVLFCRAIGIPAYTVLGPIYMPGTDNIEKDKNMIFNLTNVAWHGWVMVYMPTKDGGAWYPVDLTFFKDAYFEDGHIKSRNIIDHITGSAFSKWDTFEYLSVSSMDYVAETVEARAEILGSNVTWYESHLMLPIDGAVLIPQQTIFDPSYIMITMVFITLLIIILIQRKPRSAPPYEGPSSS